MKIISALAVLFACNFAQATVYTCVDTNIQDSALSTSFDTSKNTGTITIPHGETAVESRTVACYAGVLGTDRYAPVLKCNLNTSTDSGYEFTLSYGRGYVFTTITSWNMRGRGQPLIIKCNEKLVGGGR